jgi:hypothetical protein
VIKPTISIVRLSLSKPRKAISVLMELLVLPMLQSCVIHFEIYIAASISANVRFIYKSTCCYEGLHSCQELLPFKNKPDSSDSDFSSERTDGGAKFAKNHMPSFSKKPLNFLSIQN